MANSAVDLSASTGTAPFFAEITGFDPYPWQCRRHEALRRGQPRAALDIPAGPPSTRARTPRVSTGRTQ